MLDIFSNNPKMAKSPFRHHNKSSSSTGKSHSKKMKIDTLPDFMQETIPEYDWIMSSNQPRILVPNIFFSNTCQHPSNASVNPPIFISRKIDSNRKLNYWPIWKLIFLSNFSQLSIVNSKGVYSKTMIFTIRRRRTSWLRCRNGGNPFSRNTFPTNIWLK